MSKKLKIVRTDAYIPREVWLLWCPLGHYVPAIDGPDTEAIPLLACDSESHASEASEYQRANYGIECYPVRVK